MTDLVGKLRHAADHAPTRAERLQAAAALGAELAQLGQWAEARKGLARLREAAAGGEHGVATLEAMILEGVIEYYENLASLSLDRVKRAQALAKAMNLALQTAKSGVWLAHLGFNFEDHTAMRKGLDAAFEGFDLLDDGLRSRACLVVADTSHYLGFDDTYPEWYDFARRYCRRGHDRAVLSAVEYNRLVVAQSRLRLQRVDGAISNADLQKNWRLEAQSVQALHTAFGVGALQELTRVSEAQSLEAVQNYPEAAEILQRLLQAGLAARCDMSEDLMRLEIDWCLAMCGRQNPNADEVASKLAIISCLLMRERLRACSFVADMAARHGGMDISSQIDELRAPALEHYKNEVATMTAAIADRMRYRSIAHTGLGK
jgi:hypothetical protein